MKRIVSMLISSAMILGIVIVALSASSAEFCGISVSLVDNITLSDDATTATMQGGSKEQGYFTIPLDTIGNGDFSIEFDYNITICESPRALNFEGHDAEGNYPVIVIPAGNHARLEGTVGGAWKFIVDGTLKQTGSFSAAFDRPMKIGFTNTNRTGSFEATVSNLKINEESGAEPSETTILFDFEDGIVGNSYRSGNLSCKEGYLTVAELGCAKNKVIKLYSDSAENSADGFIYFSAPYASFGDKFVAEFDYKVVKAGVKSFTIETKTPAGGWFTPRIETSSDWAHFAIVMNKTSGQYNIYLNGESKSSGSFDNNGTNDEPFKIGITDTANQEFEIYIDNVRFTSGTTPKASASADNEKTHTPGEAVHDNEVAPQPGIAGSYDEVVYCTACGAEISRETKTVPALSEAVVVNFDDQTAGQGYSGEYFSTSADAKTSNDCWGKTVRLKKDSGKIGRLLFESDLVGAFGDKFVIEMDFYAVDSGDSAEKFSVETKVNGSWCITGKNMTYEDGKWNHLAFVLDTSTGEYKILVNGEESAKGYQDAGTSLSIRIGFNNDATAFDAYVDNITISAGTTPTATAATATVTHTPGEAVHENEVAPQVGTPGSYEEVVYCSVCGEELSREQKFVDALTEPVTDPVTDEPDPSTQTSDLISVFTVIAVIALAGTAFAIKKKRG